LLAVAAGFALWARRNRGPLASLLIFGGTLFPVLGFLNVYPFRYSYVADHFQYLASLAIIVPVSSALTLAARRVALSQYAATGLAALLLLGLGLLTWRQAHLYTDSETLYRTTLARNPGSFMARTNLCETLLDSPGRLEEAVAPCEEALQLGPNQAQDHLNLGLIRARMPGRMPDAIAEFEAALRIRPDYSKALLDLGQALAQTPGRQADALAEFEAAARACPTCAEVYRGMGNALLAVPGRQQEAAEAFRKALRILPADAEAHYGLGCALLPMPGRRMDALAEFEAAAASQPDYEPARRMLEKLQPGR
jgi:tetratricopeptide (TPR) repeat protein